MSIMIEGFIGKQIYAKSDFKIYSFFPTTETKDLVNANTKYGNISISGALPTMMEEVKYRLSIEESNNSKYANSYTVIKMFNDAPKDNNYKDKFLQTVVTEKQYETLKTAYPNIIDMIINNESIDVSKLHGIGEKIMDKIIDKVKTDFVLIDVIGKYSDLGLTMNGLKKLYDTYHSIELIDENMEKDPYSTLTRIARIGFKIADACLLKKYPYLIDSIKRGKSCIDFLLKQNETNGNTWLGYTNLYRQLKILAPETSHHFQDIITNKEDYYYHDLSKRISLLTTYICEKEVCNRLLDINSRTSSLDIDCSKYNQVDGFPLSDEQRQIQYNLCLNSLNLLVGYGGTGKTFSTKALLDMLDDNLITYALFSPTGKASNVLKLNTGREASTIHRGLKYNPKKGFVYNTKNKLPYDVIIVDEYSMIDIFLLRDLLRAIGDNTRVVFIGDQAQIPSVGCGNVAFDMLQSSVISTSSLTKVFRFDEGGLSYVSTMIREGKPYLNMKDRIQAFGVKKDYTFVNASGDSAIKVMKNLYNKLLNSNVSPDDIMVLTGYNKGEFGTFVLNNIIQEMVNPRTANTKEIKVKNKDIEIVFRINDKVMQIVNDYKIQDINDEPCPIMNGDVGKIIDIKNDDVYIEFNGRVVVYDKSNLYKLLLAYSMTIHKSQGSQSDYVILLTPEAHTYFLNRNIMYVAVSRARKLVYHIGTPNVVNSSLKKSESLKRDTYLEEMLTSDL